MHDPVSVSRSKHEVIRTHGPFPCSRPSADPVAVVLNRLDGVRHEPLMPSFKLDHPRVGVKPEHDPSVKCLELADQSRGSEAAEEENQHDDSNNTPV